MNCTARSTTLTLDLSAQEKAPKAPECSQSLYFEPSYAYSLSAVDDLKGSWTNYLEPMRLVPPPVLISFATACHSSSLFVTGTSRRGLSGQNDSIYSDD